MAIYGKTPDELTEKIAEAQRIIEQGEVDRANPYVNDYAAQWLKLVTADMHPKNKELYESSIKLHVLPVIGNKRMAEVRPDDARMVMIALADKSASLQGKVLNTMRKMFESAVDNELIPRNPCAKLKSGGYKSKEKTALTAKQTQFKNLWRIVENRRVGEKTYVVPYSPSRARATFIREKGAKSRGGDFYYTIDFPVSPHILRHTYITNLILSGVDLKTVQYLAGHANIKITLDIYTHLTDRSPEKLLAQVNKAFEVKSEVKNRVKTQ